MDIREASERDVSTVRSVAREAWTEAYADAVPESVVDDAVSAWYADETMTRLIGDDEQVCLVAVEDREVVGFCHGATRDTEGDILRLYVRPGRWNEGIGTALLEAMEERLTEMGMERLQAMVLADNEIGKAFYESRGFEKTDEAETRLDGTTRTENVYAKAR
ncbi:GNAT family N-acetyltransferase [Halorussus marinus]|uniref:GNAT family N-acetyltransferase n=1 Tax=Halorussus marinus TaxID=2505976 RepID=UPI00106DF8D9|nr:GNAT family N-acetyltransferase [Halorussus marinus]